MTLKHTLSVFKLDVWEDNPCRTMQKFSSNYFTLDILCLATYQ